jgi:hypothetical protein
LGGKNPVKTGFAGAVLDWIAEGGIVKNDDGIKWLTAERLMELLAKLPANSRVVANRVGNLLIVSADGSRAIAYIDFLLDGSIEDMEEG